MISVVCAEDIDSWKEKLEEWGYEPLICSVSLLSGVTLIIQAWSNSERPDFSGSQAQWSWKSSRVSSPA